MAQVSFTDAEAMDKFIGFDPGLPPFDPALFLSLKLGTEREFL